MMHLDVSSPFLFLCHTQVLSTRSHFPIPLGTGLSHPPLRVWPGSWRRRFRPTPSAWAPPCRLYWGRVARHAGREMGSFHSAVRSGEPRTERMEGRGLEVDKGPLHWRQQIRHTKRTQSEGTVHPNSKWLIMYHYTELNLKEQFTQIQNYELCIIIQSSIWMNSSPKFKIMNYVLLYRAQSEGTVHSNSKLWIMYHYTELNLKVQFTQIQNDELCIIIQSIIQVS